ncbi:kinase-like domain-containing protein [Hypoxylon sp. FL1857]|nr:kinase-like domain-containing protein [Hypoxylon sp. FL1857]
MNVLPDDEQGVGTQRPALLSVASAWRDTVPALTFDRAEESKLKTEPSSTCHDRGDSAHLESALGHRTSTPDPYETQSTEDLLAQIGSGLNSQDASLQFSDIPSTTRYTSPLEQALRDAIRRYAGNDGRKFIPIGKFDEIITQENVRKEIQSWLPEDRNLDIWTKAVWDTFDYLDHATKRKAFTSRKKIFAILVLFNAQTRIASFIREGLWDKDLPIEQNNENKWVCYPNGKSSKACTLECMNGLSGQDADSFDTYQWLMLSPIFNMAEDRVIFYDLHPRITLPFLELERGKDPALVGGQGEVFRVKIDESHCILNRSMGDQPKDFAIKELVPTNKEHFDSEVESLKRFSNSGHPHLIKLYATYYQATQLDSGYYNLIFPWADGNLRHFWKRHATPTRSYELLLWIADQCRGIAEGLRMIHNNEFEKTTLRPSEVKKGRHGDIKPENILWYKDSTNTEQPGTGILKISDFGLTRWHRDVSSNKSDRGGVFISKTYRAPEYDMKKPPSQSWDIWALGCLFLEFLTWYLCGWNKGADEFSKDRAHESSDLGRKDNYTIGEDHFFNLTRGSESEYEASLKCRVIIWINKLHGTEGCSQFINDFLDLISDHMLRIRPVNRHESKEIAEILSTLYSKCKRDELYCYESAHGQRKKKRNGSDPHEVHDTAPVEFSQEMAQHLSQTIGENNTTEGRNNYHNELEVGLSAHDSFHGWNTQHNPSPNNSDDSILDGERTDSPLSPSPSSQRFPTIPVLMPPIATPNQPETTERQIVPDDQQLQIPSSIKSQLSTDSMGNLSAAGRSRSSLKATPGSSERDRASIRITSNGDANRPMGSTPQRSSSPKEAIGGGQANGGEVIREEHPAPEPRRRRLLRGLRSFFCLCV